MISNSNNKKYRSLDEDFYSDFELKKFGSKDQILLQDYIDFRRIKNGLVNITLYNEHFEQLYFIYDMWHCDNIQAYNAFRKFDQKTMQKIINTIESYLSSFQNQSVQENKIQNLDYEKLSNMRLTILLMIRLQRIGICLDLETFAEIRKIDPNIIQKIVTYSTQFVLEGNDVMTKIIWRSIIDYIQDKRMDDFMRRS